MKPTLTPICQHTKWGFVNSDGHIVVPCIYHDVNEFYFGHVAAVRSESVWRFITVEGHFASEFSYDVQYPYLYRYVVQRNGLWGFVNVFGQEIIPCQFEDIVLIDDEIRWGYGVNVTPVCLKKKWGLIDKYNQLVLPCRYDLMGSIYEDTVEVKIRDRWQWITYDGRPTNAPTVGNYKIFSWRSQ